MARPLKAKTETSKLEFPETTLLGRLCKECEPSMESLSLSLLSLSLCVCKQVFPIENCYTKYI